MCRKYIVRFPRVSFDGYLEAVVGRFEVFPASPSRKARKLPTMKDTPEFFCKTDFRLISGRSIYC
jgi:hypothetical protein